MRKKLLYITLLIGFVGFAQQQPKVSAKADSTKIKIGERINYEIIVENADKGVVFPEFEADSLGRIEVIESLPIDTLKERLVKKYALTSFDSGRYTIPPQRIKIWAQEYTTDSIVIDVNTVAVDTLKQPMYEIKAIQKEPLTFADFKKYIWWLLAAILIILAIVGAILYFVLRKKKQPAVVKPAIPPYELALNQLKELDTKQLWQKNKVKQYYVELTDIVRNYIETELSVPALESTTNELMSSLMNFNKMSSNDIPNETLEKLNRLLKEADLVKFAKYKPLANEIELHRQDARLVIDNLKPKTVVEEDEAVE